MLSIIARDKKKKIRVEREFPMCISGHKLIIMI